MSIPIPRKRVTIDLDGKLFKAKELSVAYLQQSQGEDEEVIALAIQDSIGDITQEDLKHFGVETKHTIYFELLKFTFGSRVTKEESKAIISAFNLTQVEYDSMSSDTQLQLKNTFDARKPRDKEAEKKH